MIVVSVQLWSARTGQKSELARMEIANDGTGTSKLRNYIAKTLRGRCVTSLNQKVTQRGTTITRWPSEQVHIWNLVALALVRMGYGTPRISATDAAELFAVDAKDEAAA